LVINSLYARDPGWLFEPGKDLSAVRRGKKVYVSSRTRPWLVHVVDLEKGTCSCEAGQHGIHCWHLEAAQYAETADNV